MQRVVISMLPQASTTPTSNSAWMPSPSELVSSDLRSRGKAWVLELTILIKQMDRPVKRAQTSDLELHQADLSRLSIMMWLLASMMMASDSTLTQSHSELVRSVRKEELRPWVLVPTLLSVLMLRPVRRFQTSTWDHHQADQAPSLKEEM